MLGYYLKSGKHGLFKISNCNSQYSKGNNNSTYFILQVLQKEKKVWIGISSRQITLVLLLQFFMEQMVHANHQTLASLGHEIPAIDLLLVPSMMTPLRLVGILLMCGALYHFRRLQLLCVLFH